MSRRISDYDLAVFRRSHGEPNFPLPPKPRKKQRNEEARIQAQVIAWWAAKHREYELPLELLFHVPNGGWRDLIGAAILKRQGQRNGVCDLMLSVARGPYHGLFVEMKQPTGVVSGAQQDFIAAVNRQGYCARVCWSYDQAVALIAGYLEGKEIL